MRDNVYLKLGLFSLSVALISLWAASLKPLPNPLTVLNLGLAAWNGTRGVKWLNHWWNSNKRGTRNGVS